jgi:hypothetical protein
MDKFFAGLDFDQIYLSGTPPLGMIQLSADPDPREEFGPKNRNAVSGLA